MIINPRTCDYVYNGGCVFMMHETNFQLHSYPGSVDQLITLGSGASGTETLLYDPHVLIHMPRTNLWISSWMNLLKIPESRLIYDPIIEARSCMPRLLEWMNHYNFNFHHDQSLPSLQQQIFRFVETPIVIAPYEAGLLLTTISVMQE
eukprot:gene8283-8960_t